MKNRLQFTISRLLLPVLGAAVLLASPAAGETYRCVPTPQDEMGPLYRPHAPLRHQVGTGYLLMGTVKSALDCQPIAAARVEIWLVGPDGEYGAPWRATLFSAANGSYFFQSHAPPAYGLGRPHIHIKVSMDGFEPLITQHYPAKHAGEALFDLVLVPEEPVSARGGRPGGSAAGNPHSSDSSASDR